LMAFSLGLWNLNEQYLKLLQGEPKKIRYLRCHSLY
jgi:hypothetical protein